IVVVSPTLRSGAKRMAQPYPLLVIGIRPNADWRASSAGRECPLPDGAADLGHTHQAWLAPVVRVGAAGCHALAAFVIQHPLY
ncbi:MAG TPA: hypothetical protein VFY92_05030, partial [Hyphomicrobiaceae bacterium]|nr:hypothetical protein [Hyphomicrobiaceae bacterium]